MASTAGQMQTAFNAVLWDGRIPLYENGEYLYLRSEYNTAAQGSFTQRAMLILNNMVCKTDESGVLLDVDGNAASGVAAADSDTTGGGNDTCTDWPIFYQVRYVDTQEVTIVHESQILNIAGVNAIRDANNWTDPV